MQISYYSITNPGDRDCNEDSFGILNSKQNFSCFVVADGLGGHGMGEIASQLTVESFSELIQNENRMQLSDFLNDGFLLAQQKVLERQEILHNRRMLKTTAVVLCIQDDKLQWGHVGASRLYAFRKKKLVQKTKDHSVPQMLVQAKEIKEKDVRFHPDRNRLLRAIGVPWDTPQFELSEVYSARDFSAFLLCSDGFWELITEKEMQKLLKSSATPQEWLNQMGKIVLNNGADVDMDNYTAVALFIH